MALLTDSKFEAIKICQGCSTGLKVVALHNCQGKTSISAYKRPSIIANLSFKSTKGNFKLDMGALFRISAIFFSCDSIQPYAFPCKNLRKRQRSGIAGIYVFDTWSFCTGRKTSTIGLFELCIIINCWIFCAYMQILTRDVEDFCVHAQKLLIVLLNNKVFERWIICAYP